MRVVADLFLWFKGTSKYPSAIYCEDTLELSIEISMCPSVIVQNDLIIVPNEKREKSHDVPKTHMPERECVWEQDEVVGDL